MRLTLYAAMALFGLGLPGFAPAVPLFVPVAEAGSGPGEPCPWWVRAGKRR